MILGGVVSILIWIILLPAIYLLGSFVQRWISIREEPLHGICLVAFGLGILSCFIVLIGSFHALTVLPVVGFLGLAFLFRSRHLTSFKDWVVATARFFSGAEAGLFQRTAVGLFLATSLVTLFLCFLPEIAHDSLAYHLNLPKLFAANASVMPIKYELKSYQSQFMESLYTIGILLNSVPVAKLFHWLTSFLLAVALMVVVDARTGRRTLAIVMGTMLWLTPTLLNQVAMTYNDAATAFFLFLSFLLFIRALYPEAPMTKPAVRTEFLMSGFLMGFAVSCKFLALTSALPMGLFAFYEACRKGADRRQLLEGVFLFSLGILAVSGYWFLRNAWLTGSPLYPLFTRDGGIYNELYEGTKACKGLLSFLLLPVLLVFHPDPFERFAWMGPFYLLLLPFVGVAVVKAKGRVILFSVFVILVSVFFWYHLSQDVRFLLPLFPIFLMVAAGGVQASGLFVSDRLPGVRSAGKLAVLLLAFFLFAVGAYHYRAHLRALFGGWSSEVFLRRLERTYPAAEWVNKHLPADAKIFIAADYRHFYFDRPMIDASYFYWVERYSDKMQPAEFLNRLKTLGITHILRVVPFGSKLESAGTPFAVIDKLLKDHSRTVLMKEIPSQNIREARCNYQVFALR